MTPAPRGGQRLRVDVSDARGRRLSGPDVSGLGPWLSRAAPPGTRGRVTIAPELDVTAALSSPRPVDPFAHVEV